MTEIEPMPCGGRIAVETPGYNPCDDCQGLRALCGATPCPRADEFVTVPLRAVIPKDLTISLPHPNSKPPLKYQDDDPSDPRPPGTTRDPAVQRWLYRRRQKAAGKAVRSYKDEVLPTETAEVIPEFVEVPEPATAPQERAADDELSKEALDELIEKAADDLCMTAEEVDMTERLETNRLLREILAELRRPKTFRLTVCDGGVFLEEVGL